jgi:protein TonB
MPKVIPPPRENPDYSKYPVPEHIHLVGKPIKVGTPGYPLEAFKKGYEGWVLMQFDIGMDGRPSNITVVDASPAKYFERPALSAMSEFIYNPVIVDEKPVIVKGMLRWMTFEIGE